jgi:hypothetical protein
MIATFDDVSNSRIVKVNRVAISSGRSWCLNSNAKNEKSDCTLFVLTAVWIGAMVGEDRGGGRGTGMVAGRSVIREKEGGKWIGAASSETLSRSCFLRTAPTQD